MMARGLNAPLASSCGRLFDAVSAALGLCVERQGYEGHAGTLLEAIAAPLAGEPYAFGEALDPAPMWRSLLDDLARGVPAPVIAGRFHAGLARSIAATAKRVHPGDTIALSGGCFQNRVLLEQVSDALAAEGFTVLTHADVPANDGGLALGQAAIGAARLIGGLEPCA
jgi:hydrogenase maturation protein HypF